jgi:pimeloyl-ACP methyl ester carboxylesterase
MGQPLGRIDGVISKLANLPGRSVRYLEAPADAASARSTLVLLHAFPLCADQWLPQLAKAPAGWRVVAPDLRGFRSSDSTPAEPVPDAMTIDGYAADVVALMDHLEIARAVVAGLSMGGYVAFGMVRQAKARVAGLVLAHTRASADSPEGRGNRDRMIDLARREGPEAIARAMLPKLLGETTWREQPDLAQAVGRMIRANTGDAIAAALAALRDRPDSTPLLSSIDCPALIIAGEEDALIPRADADAMHAAIKGSRLVVLPRVGHLGNLEDASAFSGVLAEFLSHDFTTKLTKGS